MKCKGNVKEGTCFRCGKELLPLFSAGACLAWQCEDCDVSENSNIVRTTIADPDHVEAWCRAYLKRRAKNNKPKKVHTYYTSG
jgi:hypothetical protein